MAPHPPPPPSRHQSRYSSPSGASLKTLQRKLTTFKGEHVRFGNPVSGRGFSPLHVPRSGLWLLALLSRSVFGMRLPQKICRSADAPAGDATYGKRRGRARPLPMEPAPPSGDRAAFFHSLAAWPPSWQILLPPPRAARLFWCPARGRGSTELRYDEVPGGSHSPGPM